jgi:hypothetical protein
METYQLDPPNGMVSISENVEIAQMIPAGGPVRTLATALLAAVAFYFLKQFLVKK